MRRIQYVLFFASICLLTSNSFACQYKDSERCSDRKYSDCDCTDLGRYRNSCLSDNKFCEAFGNIGSR